MNRRGTTAFAAFAALALHPALTVALPPAPTTHARMTGTGIDTFVTYAGGIGSTSAIRETAGKTGTVKSPAKLDFLSVTVSRARTDSSLLEWRQNAVRGTTGYKRTVTLELLDAQEQVQSRFTLSNAWPSQYAVSALPAVQTGTKASAAEGETLTLVYENLARTQ